MDDFMPSTADKNSLFKKTGPFSGPFERLYNEFFRPDLGIEVLYLEGDNMEKRLKRFILESQKEFWSRQVIFIAVLVLTLIYYDTSVGFICYFVCQLTEVFDIRTNRKILNHVADEYGIYQKLFDVFVTQSLSALAVTGFAVTIAWLEGPSIHFTPLFLMLAAIVFAAVHNYHLPQMILIKLFIYGGGFMAISAIHIVTEDPPFSSILWQQFFTSCIVMVVMVYCTMVFVRQYRDELEYHETLLLERSNAVDQLSSKSMFLSTVNHELRNPLTSIKGSLDLMFTSGFAAIPNTMAPMISLIQRNVTRLANLIDDLLFYQQLEQKRETSKYEVLDLRKILETAISLNREYSESKEISVELRGLESDLEIIAHKKFLLKAIFGIINNAIKFSNNRSTVIVEMMRNTDYAFVFVDDEGEGIKKADQSRIFDPFTQADLSDTRSAGGAGLGLSITRRIVELHGGSVIFKTEEGVGTTFVIQIPLIQNK